jgi:uncharacterized protein YyaL (SSP411 family)
VSGRLHFSPRPNRAAEIAWRDFAAETFEEATREQKPVLLSLSAVWCHWCHVMDETSYSDPAVIATINERFIPVRVDADERPDVNSRYNLGGWPTTAFLTSDGFLLGGGTYVPPQAMRPMLEDVANAWSDQRDEIRRRIAERTAGVSIGHTPDGGELSETIVQTVLASIDDAFDDVHGGLGTDQKFPHVPSLALLLLQAQLARDERRMNMLMKTLRAMAAGGMYDHVEGGFFRYSTTRDWSVPHFEKMLEDHAGLLPVYAQAWRLTHDDVLLTALQTSLAYLQETLQDPQNGLFAGSQDADEHYYTLDRSQRRELAAPYVDRTVYVNWNAGMASALSACARAMGDGDLSLQAGRILDAIDAELRDARGLCFHFRRPGEQPELSDLLTDQSAYLKALIDAHEVTGQPRFLARAAAHAQATAEVFGTPDGPFVDRAGAPDQPGMLQLIDRPLAENAQLADSFLRLAALTGEEHWAARARAVLRAFSERYEQQKFFASSYAAAVARAIVPEASVMLVGTIDKTAELRETALRAGGPLLAIGSIEPGDPALAARGFLAGREATAYVCSGRACGPPIAQAPELVKALG